jgi:6-phosphogluconolactonase
VEARPQTKEREMITAMVLLGANLLATDASDGETWVYVGTYTGKESKGIYRLRLDLSTGSLVNEGIVAEVQNPSFLAIDPEGRRLYSVAEIETFDGGKAGGVAAFEIDPGSGALTKINEQSSGGPGPCHLVVDRRGKAVLVANYGGGSVAALPIGPNGRLEPASAFLQHAGRSVNPRRQERPHAHSINVDPSNRYAFVADLGVDKIFIYRFNADDGSLEPNDPPFVATPPGGGPRHFALHPSGKFAYANNELTSDVNAFAYDSKSGALTLLQTVSTLPPESRDDVDNSTAEVQVHPSGRFVYVSNRGHDSIAVFEVDEDSGKLDVVEYTPTGGKVPRNFGIDPTGRWLLAANQDSDNVVVFRIDAERGRLTPTGVEVEAPTPVCVKFLPKK